jgi:hypothetical protein
VLVLVGVFFSVEDCRCGLEAKSLSETFRAKKKKKKKKRLIFFFFFFFFFQTLCALTCSPSQQQQVVVSEPRLNHITTACRRHRSLQSGLLGPPRRLAPSHVAPTDHVATTALHEQFKYGKNAWKRQLQCQ